MFYISPSLTRKLKNLRPNKSGGVISPHKPALLLAVAQLYEENFLHKNIIDFSPELVATFQRIGANVAPDYPNKLLIHMPVYHLQSSGIWHLKALPGFEKALTASKSPKSLSSLEEFVEYAYLDEELYRALLTPVGREAVRTVIMETYFPRVLYKPREIVLERNAYLQHLKEDFLKGLVADPTGIEEEEVRCAIFKQQVPKLYNYRCAVSGLQVSATLNITMVDACHIQPWSVAHNDTIQNGICLTPTLHRAFDRGLITVSENYTVLVSKAFTEDGSSPYALRQFSNKQLSLPANKDFHPLPELLEWHRSNIWQH